MESLIAAVMERLGGQNKLREHHVFGAYSDAVGEMLRQRSEPEALNGTTLVVRVASSALAHQLTLLKGEILTKIRAAVGERVQVTDIRTRVGPLGR